MPGNPNRLQPHVQEPQNPYLSRRTFLRRAIAIGLAGTGAGGLLAACALPPSQEGFGVPNNKNGVTLPSTQSYHASDAQIEVYHGTEEDVGNYTEVVDYPLNSDGTPDYNNPHGGYYFYEDTGYGSSVVYEDNGCQVAVFINSKGDASKFIETCPGTPTPGLQG